MIITNYDLVTTFITQHLSIDVPAPDRGATIGWVRNGQIVAGVMYERYTGSSVVASIAVLPGSRMSAEFLWTIFDYPFNQLEVDVMLVFIEAVNIKSKQMVEKMGFVQCASVSGVFPSGSMVIYTIEKSQCRYLKDRYHGKEKQNTKST